MKIHLALSGVVKISSSPLPEWTALQQTDRFGVHTLCDDPEKADLVLFTDLHQQKEPHLRRIRGNALWKKYPKKCLVYDERDLPQAPLPGIFVSLPRAQFDARLHRACSYFRFMQNFDNRLAGSPDLLFSFCGAMSHPVRRRLLKIHSSRGIMEDSGVSFFASDSDPKIAKKQHDRKVWYRDLLQKSKFVLCPRGNGTTSFRLFEVMGAGRVPVIISDDWVEIPGIDWTSCAVKIPENEVESLPEILTSFEDRFNEMSVTARHVYKEYFGRDVIFHRLVEECLALQSDSNYHPGPLYSKEYYRVSLRHTLRRIKNRF